MLLDLSAAFDTVDHGVLYQVLSHHFGVTDQALDWIQKFLTDHEWAVHHETTVSQAYTMLYGVPQGTVLGPKLFSQYAEDVTEILERCMQHHHIYADDMQGLRHGKPAEILQIVTQVENGTVAPIPGGQGGQRTPHFFGQGVTPLCLTPTFCCACLIKC